MSLISITEVKKRFGANEVLKGIDLVVERGGGVHGAWCQAARWWRSVSLLRARWVLTVPSG